MAQNPMQMAAGLMGRSPYAKRFQMGQQGQSGMPPAMPFGYNPQGMPQGEMRPPVASTPPILDTTASTPPILSEPVKQPPIDQGPPKLPPIDQGPPKLPPITFPQMRRRRPITVYNQ